MNLPGTFVIFVLTPFKILFAFLLAEVEIGGSWFKASMGKQLARLYLKKQAWHSASCL
jgi:hypothetical protein